MKQYFPFFTNKQFSLSIFYSFFRIVTGIWTQVSQIKNWQFIHSPNFASFHNCLIFLLLGFEPKSQLMKSRQFIHSPFLKNSSISSSSLLNFFFGIMTGIWTQVPQIKNRQFIHSSDFSSFFNCSISSSSLLNFFFHKNFPFFWHFVDTK